MSDAKQAQDTHTHPSPAPADGSTAKGGFLDEIRGFESSTLSPTTTTVYRGPIVDPRGSRGGGDADITGAPTDEEVVEFFDEEEDLQRKAEAFVALLRASESFVAYTGAGISTAAKIPDYRGPKGLWTLRAKGRLPEMKITLEQAIPTYTHMALVELARRGLLSHVVSTNVDGLHRRSGLRAEELSEVHGNIYREYCQECGAEYLRPFDVTRGRHRFKRCTGRLCQREDCRGRLRDSIINFGESLPEGELAKAEAASAGADLTLVLGSSMRVTPACDLPSLSYDGERGGAFCILNLQRTPYDEECSASGGLRIHARCDDFMRRVMAALEIPVPDFVLREEDLEAALADIVEDESLRDSVMSKYNVYSMADDGPPPEGILSAIRGGEFTLRRVGAGSVNDRSAPVVSAPLDARV